MRLQAKRYFTATRAVLLLGALCAAFAAPSALAQVVPSTYPLGANLVRSGEGTGVVFRVWAPNAQFVNVPGQFNAWANTGASLMVKDASSGVWSLHVPTATTGQEYKFYVRSADFSSESQRYKIDPWSRDTVNTTGNSVIRGDGSTYNWQATDWQTPDRDNMVIYELHIGTFSGNGDGAASYPARYRDVVDRHIEDIKAVGANMVEIMPVHEFPATSWGYNPVSFFAPESDYGNPDDLRYMVDKLHQNGIGVIVDVVYNHVSNSDNNLWNFDGNQNIYFFGDNCMGQTPWGATRPKYTEAQVRALLVENARYWIEEFRMDGIRVDATSFMRGYCNEMGEGG
jgi:1,4-alpha-glucan branching enzyme